MFILHDPANPGKGQKSTGAQLMDIAPTVLDLFGVEIPEDMQGRVISHRKPNLDVVYDMVWLVEIWNSKLDMFSPVLFYRAFWLIVGLILSFNLWFLPERLTTGKGFSGRWGEAEAYPYGSLPLNFGGDSQHFGCGGTPGARWSPVRGLCESPVRFSGWRW